MGEDPGYRVLEEIEATARALCGHQPPHDHAPQLLRVGHRGGLRVPVDLDRLVHRPVMQDGVRGPVLVLEQPDS